MAYEYRHIWTGGKQVRLNFPLQSKIYEYIYLHDWKKKWLYTNESTIKEGNRFASAKTKYIHYTQNAVFVQNSLPDAMSLFIRFHCWKRQTWHLLCIFIERKKNKILATSNFKKCCEFLRLDLGITHKNDVSHKSNMSYVYDRVRYIDTNLAGVESWYSGSGCIDNRHAKIVHNHRCELKILIILN